MNFNSSDSAIHAFKFNNSVINEFQAKGKLAMQQNLKELMTQDDTIQVTDLSMGIEFTDGSSSHFYDSFSQLCRYNVYTFKQVTINVVVAYQGKILSRKYVAISALEPNVKSLLEAYFNKLGLVFTSDAESLSSKDKVSSLETFVSTVTSDPLL